MSGSLEKQTLDKSKNRKKNAQTRFFSFLNSIEKTSEVKKKKKKGQKERKSEAFSVRHAPYSQGAVCSELRAVGSVMKRGKSSRQEGEKTNKKHRNTEAERVHI